ncbi:DUF554 family protein [Nigerium sp.]|uniref:DUF554 family protein n=1 Tax=Nigerium sp. TaxID=2042655 RepID=UPI0032221E52
MVFIGFGTVVNVVTVAVGAGVGLGLGNRIPVRARDVITDVLGLMTLVLGGLSAVSITSAEFARAVGGGASTLIVLGSLLVGALVGTALRLEERLEGAADWLRVRLPGTGESGTFVDAVVTPTLLFCVGPLTILGAISDGLGRGSGQLVVKAVMDGFAAIAFASTLGAGVLVAAVLLGVIQGALTLTAALLGSFLSLAQIDALSATGGVLLLALGLRLLKIRAIPVANLLPALLLAPLAVAAVGAFVH